MANRKKILNGRIVARSGKHKLSKLSRSNNVLIKRIGIAAYLKQGMK